MRRSKPSEREQLLLQIDPGVKHALKVAAVKRGEPMWSVAEAAIRDWLAKEAKAQ
jgi:hypothetical protein